MPYKPHYRAQAESSASQKQAFHRPHTSLGATGHWIREAGILAPLIISEFVEDPGKKWRYVRIASLATALVSQGFYTARLARNAKPRMNAKLCAIVRVERPLLRARTVHASQQYSR